MVLNCWSWTAIATASALTVYGILRVYELDWKEKALHRLTGGCLFFRCAGLQHVRRDIHPIYQPCKPVLLFALTGYTQQGQEYIRVSGRHPTIPVSSGTHATEAAAAVADARRAEVAISAARADGVAAPAASRVSVCLR